MSTNKNGMTFTPAEKIFYPEHVGFRKNVPAFPIKMNFVFLNGGFGDYVCWIRPIQWLAECATWIDGGLVCPTYLKELAEYWLRDYPKWQISHYKDTKDAKFDQIPYRGPIILQNESLNATGAHLMTCGWVYFTNKEKAPAGNDAKGRPWNSYPALHQHYLDIVTLPSATAPLEPKKFAVITTGITTNSRKIPGRYWMPIIKHIKARGLTPVFLGKSVVDTGNQKNIHTKWSEEIDYSLGIDLRDKTSLMQAAAIMSRAAFVVGHDNGLLHLAGCTEVPIIFGYNLASPEHRRPIRPVGKVYDVFLTQEELACTFCQSRTNFLIGYSFTECFYSDLKCMDLLFENEGKRWTDIIDQCLAEHP